ncbi:dihydroneopterin aldolase [Hyphococcus sp.]|uniref:dihydroneopterin aldolase n=1 Tax=Hyphococcus sp. TaxID=2038636 RepID=UPI0020855F3B|nr:MAG: diguanylate cyclase [Marinicaulis sp.]
MNESKKPPETLSEITPLPRSATAPRRKVFVRGLVLDAYIGAYESEKGAAQPVRIDFEAEVIEPANPVSDSMEDVVCYDRMTQGIKAILAEGHIKLVETLAERVADLVMSHPMVLSVMVRIIKPNAITEAEAVGVEIIRTKK